MHCATIVRSILLICVCSVHGFTKFNANKDVILKLYKRESPTNFIVLNENNSTSFDAFDPTLPTRIFAHGFSSSSITIENFRDAYLSAGNFNFIAIDWTISARHVNYFVVKTRMKSVSKINFFNKGAYIWKCLKNIGFNRFGEIY